MNNGDCMCKFNGAYLLPSGDFLVLVSVGVVVGFRFFVLVGDDLALDFGDVGAVLLLFINAVKTFALSSSVLLSATTVDASIVMGKRLQFLENNYHGRICKVALLKNATSNSVDGSLLS